MNAPIWIIDDDRSIRWVLERALTQAQMTVTTFASAHGVIERIAHSPPEVILTDIRMPGTDGLALLQTLKENYPHIPVIIMTAYSDLETTVAAYQGGAFEYLPKPFDIDEAVNQVRRAVASQRRNLLSPSPNFPEATPEIFGNAPAMQEVFRTIGRLSRSSATVLINGESGVGKELVARALHRHSPRAVGPFIALNTAAIPRELLESELFGHERGAFTGAQTLHHGRFEQADNGTLFLDEIGDMPAELQTRLLRVLAEGEFYRVGGRLPLKVDVRIIAATHQDLDKLVAQGIFREDLFHRLNVIRIYIPPLRARREDIPHLARNFLAIAAQELKCDPKNLRPETELFLQQLDWPGNVRQLENLCHWLTVMTSGPEIYPEDLPIELRNRTPSAPVNLSDDWEIILERWTNLRLAQGEFNLLDNAIPRLERVMITATLRHTAGQRQEAARLLGWGRNTLTRKIKELKIAEFISGDEHES